MANNNNNHTAMMPNDIQIDLTQGSHEITIQNMNSETTTDVNDVIQIVLLY